MKKPSVLYHYTSVESLAMILSTRKLRLSPLSVLDDLQEEKTEDISLIGKTVFISSWTEDEEESIPMWNMYSKMESGVRIKADVDLLEDFTTREDKQLEVSGFAHHTDDRDIFPPTLRKIDYTADKNKLIPKIVSSDGQIWNQKDFGVYKNTAWAFQKEWRYIVRVWPGKNFEEDGDAESIYRRFASIVDSHIDINIKQKAFENLEVTLSPKISAANKIFVKLLRKEYCPSLKVKNSKLHNGIR